MHAMLRSTKGISTLSLLILLLASGVVGAVLSYLWTVGYYIEIGLRVPEDVTTITIIGATFLLENCTYFNVTVLNPTYSEADANIINIALIVVANNVERIYYVESVEPPTIPYLLKKGEDITFKCNLNWGEYAGQNIAVVIFVDDGSGATTSYQTELAGLDITELVYNTTVTINQFNVTIRNRSSIPLNVSEIRLDTDSVPADRILVNGQNITFPYEISDNETTVFVCDWALWDAETNSGVLGNTKEIVVETTQGYFDSRTETYSDPVILTLSNVTYPQLNTTHFTLRNDQQSPHHVNLSNITISVGNETFAVNTNVTVGYLLEKGSNITILCEDERFNWENSKGEKITIKVYTTQGFLAKKEETIPSE